MAGFTEDRARWARMQELFHAAAALAQGERAAMLREACAGDEALMQAVLAMLEEDGRGQPLLDRQVGGVAATLLGAAGSPAPRSIGPYRLLRVLGEGGMGIVYLAERADLGSQVAIKLLRDAWISPLRLARFEHERHTLAQLVHPSIARLYDAGTLEDGTPWFAMEYVEGAPITEYVRARGLDARRTLRLFREVCEAVLHAHRHAVIHRDLKPSNIYVRADGTVRLLDFGIAKSLESNEEGGQRTQTALRLLTPAYASPEQLRGEAAGTQTDVYSLGLVLHELLSGRGPREGTPSQEPLPDSELEVICRTAAHPDRSRRYGSVEALLRDVDHYLAGEPLEARPDNLAYRTRKFVSRHRGKVAAAAGVFVLVNLLAGFFTLRLASAKRAAVAEAERTLRTQAFMLRLFEGGDPEAGPADRLTVAELVNRGVLAARSLRGESELQAELFHTLGGISHKLGDFRQAEELLEAALDSRSPQAGSDPRPRLETMTALSLLRADQSKLDEAEDMARQAMEQAQATLGPTHPAALRAATVLGRILSDRGQYPAAIELLQRSSSEAEAARSDEALLAGVLFELANALFYSGRYGECERLNRRLIEMHRRLHGHRHPAVAEDLVNLGAVEFELGRYPQAEAFYRQALEITRDWYGEQHHRTAANLTMLSRALIRLNRQAEAVELLERSLAIRERVYGKASPQTASTWNEIGTVALQRGLLDDAEAAYSRMVAIYRGVHGERHYLVAVGLSNLATVESNRKRYEKAEALYRDAVRRFSEALSPEHSQTAIARIKLGRSLVLQRKWADAEPEILAGYQLLSKESAPGVSFLQAARSDLAKLYRATGRTELAGRYEREWQAAAAKP